MGSIPNPLDIGPALFKEYGPIEPCLAVKCHYFYGHCDSGTPASTSGWEHSAQEPECRAQRSRTLFLELEVRRVECRRCGKVKRERLDFLADNPFYTKRFAYYVGRRCRGTTIKDVAEELALDWHTVKALDMQYMRAQLKPRGHAWSAGDRHRRDLDPQGSHLPDRGQRPLARPADLVWRRGPLGGEHEPVLRLARPEEELAHSPGGDGHVEAFSQLATNAHAPQAAILFDKFHVIRHLGEALDTVRKSEYCPADGQAPALHQGPEIHAAVAQGEPDAGGQAGA